MNLRGVHVRNIFSENNSKAPRAQKRSASAIEHNCDEADIRIQMPVDVAVEEPWARVVGEEPDGDLINCGAGANAYDVAHDGVVPVVYRAVRATDYVECVLVVAV